REFGEFHFGRTDLHVEMEVGQRLLETLKDSPPANFAGLKVSSSETTDGTKLLFADDSWILFRQSGTEPMLRIYAEAADVARVRALLEAGEELAVKG
ncbi:MAG: phosphoglucomutase/phosphomannomutase family protein, partial [bacterium]